jgi:hypothetical protein
MLLLWGIHGIWGRTGNNLIEFLHALQWCRDEDLILGIMTDSWVFHPHHKLMSMFMGIDGEGWEEKWEDVFCGE